MTLIPTLTFTDYEWFPWSICNGCDMPAGNTYPSGHLVPSSIVGLACMCSNCWDQIPRTCHVFTRLFTSNTPWYFLDFAFNFYLLWFAEFELQKCNGTIFSLACCDFTDVELALTSDFLSSISPGLSGDNHRLPWYGNCISQLVRFSRCCTSVLDFHLKKSLNHFQTTYTGFQILEASKNIWKVLQIILWAFIKIWWNIIVWRISFRRNLRYGLLRWSSLQS